MSVYTRKNAWDANNGGQFQDANGNYTDLYWYAKAVQTTQKRPINDPTSWWFYGAIHGQFLTNTIRVPKYLRWKNISYISPSADLDNLPSKGTRDLYWDQCQHGTWFFPPWHRGYLVSLEVMLRNVITQELKGPEDWSLPYWNYLKNTPPYDQSKIPPAFLEKELPDGSANPLLVPERYGPKGDGNIYVVIGPSTSVDDPQANDRCQVNTIYNELTPHPVNVPGNYYGNFYGGLNTGFNHGGNGFGDLEMNPHNFVHTFVGGRQKTTRESGLMAVPATAALDPIFYLHHANIDRMWAAWNVTGGNKNSELSKWLDGPVKEGSRKFAMPLDKAGSPWHYTPKDVQDTEKVNFNSSNYAYTYDDLSLISFLPIAVPSTEENFVARLTKLGVAPPEDDQKLPDMPKINDELVGANSGALVINNTDVSTSVQLETKSMENMVRGLKTASFSSQPDQVFLELEDVKGVDDANFLSVFINEKYVSSVSLFGLLLASTTDGPHGGSGLNYRFNITDLVDELHLDGSINANSLNVQIKAKDALNEDSPITIGRVGIYRAGQ